MPATTLDGDKVMLCTWVGLTVRVAVLVELSIEAVIVLTTTAPELVVAAEKVALVAPLAIETLAGTVTALLLLVRAIIPDKVVPVSWTVPVDPVPAYTVVGDMTKLDRVAN